MPDPVVQFLDRLNTSNRVRAAAWAAMKDTSEGYELVRRLDQLPFSGDIKGQLWEMKFGKGAALPEQQGTATAEKFAEPSKVPPQTFGHAAGSFLEQFNPIAMAKGIGTMVQAGMGNVGAQMTLAQPHIDTANKAGQAFKDGRLVEAGGYGLATALPMVGPAAAAMGEQGAQGDVAGMVGGGLGLATQAVAPGVIGRAVSRPGAAAKALPGNAARMEQALNATTRENKVRAQRVAPEMVRRGIAERNLPALEERAATESAAAGRDVGAAVDAVSGVQRDVMPIVEKMEALKEPYIDTVSGRRVVLDEGPVAAIQKLQDTLMQFGDQVSTGSLNKLRQRWDDVVQRNKGFTTDDVGQMKAWAAREGRSVLRDELSAVNPDIDRVMAEYAFWQNIEDVTHATNLRKVGQKGNLTSTIAAGAGAVAAEALVPGSGVGSKAGMALIGAKAASSLQRLFESPGYKMLSAVWKQRLAEALASRNTERIGATVGKTLAAAESAAASGRVGILVPTVADDPASQPADTARR